MPLTTVRGMNALERFLASFGEAFDILELAQGMSKHELISRGAPASEAKRLVKLSEVYFGPCRSRAIRRRVMALSRAQGHTLAALARIESLTSSLDDASAWRLREKLAAVPEKEFSSVAAAEKPQPEIKTELRIRRKRALGQSTLSITAPSADVDEIFTAVRSTADGDNVDDWARSFLKLWKSGGAQVKVSTTVGIMLDEAVKIDAGEDDDILLTATDGRIMTGAELVGKVFSSMGRVILVHPVEGPVNLYRKKRTFSAKQREMAAFANPVCTADGCGVGADFCQVHHIEPWLYGGQSNFTNAVTMCKFHNARNDDNPNAPPKWGRAAKAAGQGCWISPIDGRRILNAHPAAVHAPLRRFGSYY